MDVGDAAALVKDTAAVAWVTAAISHVSGVPAEQIQVTLSEAGNGGGRRLGTSVKVAYTITIPPGGQVELETSVVSSVLDNTSTAEMTKALQDKATAAGAKITIKVTSKTSVQAAKPSTVTTAKPGTGTTEPTVSGTDRCRSSGLLAIVVIWAVSGRT